MTRKVLLGLASLLLSATAVFGQRGTGEVRVSVRDGTGAVVQASGVFESSATHVRRTFRTDSAGAYIANDVPFGPYRLRVEAPGFAPFESIVDVRSEVPQTFAVTLAVGPLQTTVTVSNAPDRTLLDPYRPASVQYLGTELVNDRPSAAPGRSIIELVNTQPGWVLEANGILHPRASEYQVQYVVDGIPLRDNRSPTFAQSLGIEQFGSMTVRTAGYPAEYGGKLGGIIEVNSLRAVREGFHGAVGVQAGSFQTFTGDFAGVYAKGRTSAGVAAEGMRTDRYLDPPVQSNDTNDAAGGGVAAHAERNWNDTDRTRTYVDHHRTSFQVPNEALQEQAGQRQDRFASETLGYVTHDHILSPDAFASVRFMARDTGASLSSNARSTPIAAFQDRGFREAYVNGAVTLHRGRHDVKAGTELTWAAIDEAFSSTIVAYQLNGVRIFDRDVPAAFAFSAHQPHREQAVYAQDFVRLGPATVSAGVRYDHYHLMVDEHAVSPRLAASWHIAPAALLLHASYDRAFQTPSIENILLASSDLVKSLGGEGRSLTLRPSRGNFYEAGVSKTLFGALRADANYFYRTASNYADDDLLLNTAVSFPIAFARGTVEGVEAKLEMPRWRRLSGALSYSYSTATGQLPVSGGLFLGDEADELLNSRESFPISQDQRHTLRGRLRHELPWVWVAAAVQYNSGLPVEAETPDLPLLVEQYGQAVVDRVDFAGGRVRPSTSIDLSLGVDLARVGWRGVHLQADVFNVTNRLNVINFAGLFSGTAVGPPRHAAVRVRVDF